MDNESTGKYYGKYRGTVINNVDPMQMGRLMLQVPDVYGVMPSTWAMPCLPFAGKQMGMYCLPQIGAGVWVEFEQGSKDYPIWVGGWWGSAGEVPSMALAAPPVTPPTVIQTTGQNMLMLSDVPGPTGGIMLKTTTGAMIVINDVGILIDNGKGASILMSAATVTINQGALVVT